jgi:acyl-homoserine lactone acylase PvdQ
VEIIRDTQGIPHIYAQNDDDLFFAQGYVMAQDRLWQLEMWRRWREGRLAEIFGPKAFDYDARTRLMIVPRPVGRTKSGRAITPTPSGCSRRGPTVSTATSPPMPTTCRSNSN